MKIKMMIDDQMSKNIFFYVVDYTSCNLVNQLASVLCIQSSLHFDGLNSQIRQI